MLDALRHTDWLVLILINSRISNPVLDAAMPAFSCLGVWWLGAGVILAVVIWRRSRASLLAGLSWGIAGGASMGLKLLVTRARPALLPEVILRSHPWAGANDGFPPWAQSSFPSGHTTAAFAAAALIANYWPRYRAVAYAVAAVVGISRVYLGVHYPTDVAAGALLGIGVTKAVLFNPLLRRKILGEEKAEQPVAPARP